MKRCVHAFGREQLCRRLLRADERRAEALSFMIGGRVGGDRLARERSETKRQRAEFMQTIFEMGPPMRSNGWFILVVLFVARFCLGHQFQSVGSVAPFLISEFGLDYRQIGTLVGPFMLPGFVLALPG